MHPFEEIQTTIRNAVDPEATIHILDPRQDGVHLEALVISTTFRELSLIQQQKKVMNALKEHFATSLHALGLRTFTPEQWEEKRSDYNL